MASTTWRGDWDAGTAYAPGDGVNYAGKGWFCVTANTGQAPGDGDDWALGDEWAQPPPGEAHQPLMAGNNLSDLVSRQAALNNLAGAVTAGRYVRGDGTNATLAAIQAADLPAIDGGSA